MDSILNKKRHGFCSWVVSLTIACKTFKLLRSIMSVEFLWRIPVHGDGRRAHQLHTRGEWNQLGPAVQSPQRVAPQHQDELFVCRRSRNNWWRAVVHWLLLWRSGLFSIFQQRRIRRCTRSLRRSAIRTETNWWTDVGSTVRTKGHVSNSILLLKRK